MSQRTTQVKSLSIEPPTLKLGKSLARKRGFKNSFSAYVSWLIEQDRKRQASAQVAG